jgi:hypothetical protein
MRILCLAALGLLVLSGCEGEKKKSRVDEILSAAEAKSSQPPPGPPEPKQYKEVPSLTVDELGAYLGGERADPSTKDGLAKLKNIVSRIPLSDKDVTLIANKKANTQDVKLTAWEWGKGGAATILVKSEGRAGVPTEILLTPEHTISDPPACSVSVAVTEKLDTGVWPYKGGGGKKHRPGFGGPDMSNTEKSIEKALGRCKSKYAFFGGAYKHQWLHVYSLGALIKKMDADKKIDKLVLLTDEPVAGRKVKLRK